MTTKLNFIQFHCNIMEVCFIYTYYGSDFVNVKSIVEKQNVTMFYFFKLHVAIKSI